MKKVCIIISMPAVMIACSSKTFASTGQQLSTMQQKVPGITLESATAGYKLYSEKCAGCHQLYNPGKYTIVQWNNILPKMFPKGKVSNEREQKLILAYLHALSK